MIAIIDYGMGNLRSVQKALEKAGAKDVLVTQNVNKIEEASKVVLPGVGAIQPAVERLDQLNLIAVIKKTISSGKPFLGICLGLQLLFEKSSEGGKVKGLGILEGSVERFQSLKVPHMGWNQINIKNASSTMYQGIGNRSDVYFCHSYYVQPKLKEVIASTTDYGMQFVSSVCRDNLWGVQFHPEKSQAVGLNLLKNFVRLKP